MIRWSIETYKMYPRTQFKNNFRVILVSLLMIFSAMLLELSVSLVSPSPLCNQGWICRRRWWSACPPHHLLIRVLAPTAQNWINLSDPCCCFPSRGQLHITALTLRQRHTLLNEILFFPLPPSCLSVFIYLWLSVLTRAWSFAAQTWLTGVLVFHSKQRLNFE